MSKCAALLFMSCLCFSALARADDDSDMPFYVEAGVGEESVNYNSYSQDSVNQGVISGTGTALSLIGGSTINDNFAIEVGYHDYGSPTTGRQSGQSVSLCPAAFSCPHVSAFTAEAVGRFTILPDLTGEVLGGLQAWNIGSPGSTVIGKSSGDSFIYGVRVRHVLHDQFEGWSVDVTYEYSAFSTSETRVGLRYTF
jgi:hypothetical protein